MDKPSSTNTTDSSSIQIKRGDIVEKYEFEEQLEKLLIHWEEVEQSMKRAELLQGHIIMPALNELRYAGRDIILAVSQNRKTHNNSVYENAIICADRHLSNAEECAIEATVLYVSSRINEFNLRFGRQAIINNYSFYPELLHTMRICQENVIESSRHSADKKFLYNKMKSDDLPRLLAQFDKLVDADIIMTLQLQDKKNKTSPFRYWSYIAITLAAILASVVAAFITRTFI